MSDFADERKTLRRAATLIRRIDSFCDGKLEEEGVPAREIAAELLQLANDLTLINAMDRVRGVAAEDRHSVRADPLDIPPLRMIRGGA